MQWFDFILSLEEPRTRMTILVTSSSKLLIQWQYNEVYEMKKPLLFSSQNMG